MSCSVSSLDSGLLVDLVVDALKLDFDLDFAFALV
jgi:hypothetical protein